MTDTQIEVSQRARGAAADWAKMQSRHAQAANMRRGSCDTAPLVQLFARFERDILATRTDATPVAWMYERKPDAVFPEAPSVIVKAGMRWADDDEARQYWTEVPLYTHPPATDVAALVENGCEMPEVAAMRYIEELRSDLAASVTILCDNEEAWTKDEQMAVEVIAEWTDWLAKRFMGESVIQCLARAVEARRQALAPFTKGQP